MLWFTGAVPVNPQIWLRLVTLVLSPTSHDLRRLSPSWHMALHPRRWVTQAAEPKEGSAFLPGDQGGCPCVSVLDKGRWVALMGITRKGESAGAHRALHTGDPNIPKGEVLVTQAPTWPPAQLGSQPLTQRSARESNYYRGQQGSRGHVGWKAPAGDAAGGTAGGQPCEHKQLCLLIGELRIHVKHGGCLQDSK